MRVINILTATTLGLCLVSTAQAEGGLLAKKSFCSTNQIAEKTVLSPDGKQVFVISDVGAKSVLWSIDKQKWAIFDVKHSAGFLSGGRKLVADNYTEWMAKDGDAIYQTSGSRLAVWDIAQHTIAHATRPTSMPDLVVDAVLVSPNGKIVASHSMEGWEMPNGKSGSLGIFDESLKLLQVIGGEENIEKMVFSPNAQQILIIVSDMEEGNQVQLYSVANGNLIKTFPQNNEGDFVDAAFAPDGKSVVFAGFNAVYQYDLNGHLLNTFGDKQQENFFNEVAFSPDGKTIAAVRENQLYLWNVASKAMKKYPLTQKKRGRGLQFTPDSQGLFIGCEWYEVGEKSLFLQAANTQSATPKSKLAKKFKNDSKDSTLLYYPDFPFITVQYEYKTGENCAAPTTENNARWVVVPYTLAQSEGNVSDSARAQVNNQGYFDNGDNLRGRLHQDGTIEGVFTLNRQAYPFHKSAPKQMKKRDYCEYREEDNNGKGEDYLSKVMYLNAQTLPETHFGEQQWKREKRQVEQEFAKSEMSGMYSAMRSGIAVNVEQQLVYAEGDLLSFCAKRDIDAGGASNSVNEECRIYYQGRKIEPRDIFYDLNNSNFYASDLRKFLLSQFFTEGMTYGDNELQHLSNNFYADHNGIVFVFRPWESSLTGKQGGKIKLTYDELREFIDLSEIGK